MLHRVEAAALNDLAELLNGLGDAGRREVARHLPAHLAGRLRGGVEARWRVQELAPGYRLAGAACLGGAEQVASWLDRRELRRVPAAEADAVRVLSLIRDRPEEWRRDLAVRLVRRLRPVTGSPWRWGEQLQGWDLAAGLAIETGIEPPGNDAFVAGWVWAAGRAAAAEPGSRRPHRRPAARSPAAAPVPGAGRRRSAGLEPSLVRRSEPDRGAGHAGRVGPGAAADADRRLRPPVPWPVSRPRRPVLS
ncbi:hypothetical protein [Nonomuraea solani]|uniref:hypothetical protein n=1 Tax=Nonomuraea solani TaxID=1144553 RepID=UPI0011B028CD|nr:hypothetical protein [Nonomuraea solani]